MGPLCRYAVKQIMHLSNMHLNGVDCKIFGCHIQCCSTYWLDPELASKKWPNVQPIGTTAGYLVHSYHQVL